MGPPGAYLFSRSPDASDGPVGLVVQRAWARGMASRVLIICWIRDNPECQLRFTDSIGYVIMNSN